MKLLKESKGSPLSVVFYNNTEVDFLFWLSCLFGVDFVACVSWWFRFCNLSIWLCDLFYIIFQAVAGSRNFFLRYPSDSNPRILLAFSAFKMLYNWFTITYALKNHKQKKQTSPKKSALFCFQRRERDSCFGKRLRRLRTPTRVFSSPLIQKEAGSKVFCSGLSVFVLSARF